MKTRRLLTSLVALTLVFGLWSPLLMAGGQGRDQNPGQNKAEGRIVRTYREPEGQSARGGQAKRPDWVEDAHRRSLDFLRQQREGADQPDAAAEFRVIGAEADDLGLTHLRLNQMHNNVKVFGSQLITHLDESSVREVSGRTFDDARIDTTPAIDSAAAIEAAKTELGYTGEFAEAPKAELVILPHAISQGEGAKGATLVFRVELRIEDGTDATAHHQYFVNALDGQIVWHYNSLTNGLGHSLYVGDVAIATKHSVINFPPPLPDLPVYSMEDASRGNMQTRDMNNGASGNGTLFSQLLSDVWGDGTTGNDKSAAVDAHFGAMKTWDYYLNVFGRAGIDGAGYQVISRVHFGSNYNNAFWNGSVMTYGDGNGVTFSPLVSVDVVGHEITHGLTQKTANLIYARESGAMNESFSDIFGAAVEFYSKKSPDFLIGEDCYTPATPGDALRSMSNPPAYGDPDHYDNRLYPGACTPGPTNDNCGVHSNSGIQNKAFYLLAQGGVHPVSGVAVTGIGRRSAERIFYRALTLYLFPSANFTDARNATLNAAGDLFGAGSAEYKSTAKAWNAVGVNKWVSVFWPTINKTYFFKGSQYYRFDNATNQVDPGYPKPIAGNWPGLWADGFDAVVTWDNGKAYFFKGAQYLRMNLATFTVDAGYPRAIAGDWNSIWSDGIDAAVHWNNGKAYFFKDDQYVRFDLSEEDIDVGYPKQIAGNWTGLWGNGIDSAILRNNGKAYFFRGSQYSQYDVATNKVDAGFPKVITGNWNGLP